MDAKSATFIFTFVLILISLIGGAVTQDNCGFGFCNWMQSTSDVTYGASFSRTTGQQSGRTKKTTDRPSGHTNKTTDPQSDPTKKTTDPQSGSTNKTTDRPSGRTNKTTDPQSGSTNKTTDRPSGLTNKTNDPPSGRTNTLTGQQSGRTNKTTDPQSGSTNKTTEPQIGRTNETAEQQSGSTNKTTDQPSGRTNTITGQQSIRTNKITDPQSGHTNKTTDPPSGRPSKTTNTQSGCTNKTTETPSGLTNKATGPRNSRNNKTEDPQSASFVNCSFKDGMCDWESIFAGWKIGQASPTTSGTDSAHDHTLRNVRGIYIYLDPKSVNTSQSQELESAPLPWNCLSLWYHICDKGTGNLTVSIETKETTMATKVSTTQSGNKTILRSQEGKLDDKWHSVEITKETQEDFRVLLVGTTKIQNGAIAVDDIQLSKCCCRDSCGLGLWNWLKRITDDCTRAFGTFFPGTTSPQSGCTKNSPGALSDGTNAISTTRDLRESTFNSDEAFTKTTRPAESSIPESYTIGSRSQITTQGHIPKVTAEVITVSLVGAVMFVVLSLLVGVWICRKRRRHRGMVEPFELQPIASTPSSRDNERGYSSSAVHCISPGYIHSSNASRSGNKALINGKTDDANYKYASGFQSTTPEYWRDDTYDHAGDETKPRFDGAYDHIPTHFVEEYDATHFTIRTRLDACETYDHVTICPDGVYDETCVAQASAIQYKSYDQVTKGTCEPRVSKPNISNSQDNIYEFVA